MLLAILCGAVGANLASAEGSDPPAATEPTAEVDFGPPSEDYVDPNYRTIDGHFNSDGDCVLGGEIVAGPGREDVAVEELSYDPATCESDVVQGEVVDSSSKSKSRQSRRQHMRASPSDYDEDGETIDFNGGTTPSGNSTDPLLSTDCSRDNVYCSSDEAGGGYHGGVYKATASSYFEDPAQLDVSKVQNWITWRPDNGCAQYGPGHIGWNTSALRATGWFRDYKNFDPGANCDRILSRMSAVFENKGFCNPFSPTYNSYSPNELKGSLGGKAVHKWQTVRTGDCNGLLHFEHELNWTKY